MTDLAWSQSASVGMAQEPELEPELESAEMAGWRLLVVAASTVSRPKHHHQSRFVPRLSEQEWAWKPVASQPLHG